MGNRRLLISFAHPDDESFGLGGAISKWVAEGIDVYLICATNGEVGTIPDEMKDRFATIAELRLSELECASKKLGFCEVFKLGYKDSGMMGSLTSQDPTCLWYRWNNYPEEVTKSVVEVLRQIQPQVIVTFNRYGGYGHPDHIAIQQATMAAWDVVNDPAYVTEGLEPYQPQKMYFNHFPKFLLQWRILMARMRRQDPRRMGTNKDIDMVKILDHIEATHTRIDIRDYLTAWDEANACHASQGGGRLRGIPKLIRPLLYSKQEFTRVYPKPTRDIVDEDNVFAGISFEK